MGEKRQPFGFGAGAEHVNSHKGHDMNGRNRDESKPATPDRAHLDSSLQEQLAQARAEQNRQLQAIMGMMCEMRATMNEMKKEIDNKPNSDELKNAVKVVEKRINRLDKDLDDAFSDNAAILGTASGTIQNRIVKQTNLLWTGIDNLVNDVDRRNAQRAAELDKEIKYARGRIENEIAGL